jgi:hypothetical protein
MNRFGGGYGGILRPLSACVHFVYNDCIDDSINKTVSQVEEKGIAHAYLDYDARNEHARLPDQIADVLGLPNRPYGHLPWVELLDDLGSLSFRANGLVIVIDNADILLEKARNDFFSLTESFLTQFHHWFEKKKPCHLCFQMERNELIGKLFFRSS